MAAANRKQMKAENGGGIEERMHQQYCHRRNGESENQRNQRNAMA